MALSKKQKIIIGVVGVAVVGVAVYFLTRKKPSEDDEVSDDMVDDALKSAESGTLTVTPSNSCSGNIMGYLSYRDGGKHPVHFGSPRPSGGSYKAGDKVKISNTSFDGEYTVSSVWNDANGNVGAVYLPISYTPTGKTDRTFENKGCITKV